MLIVKKIKVKNYKLNKKEKELNDILLVIDINKKN